MSTSVGGLDFDSMAITSQFSNTTSDENNITIMIMAVTNDYFHKLVN